MYHIAILITVHNRKEKTLKCLELLYKSVEQSNMYSFDIFLTDDKSTDGTVEAINEKFPKVKVVYGNGNLYWGRGMILAWEKAYKVKDYDFYIWLNDDVHIFEDSLSKLMKSALLTDCSSIISGAFSSRNETKVTYGGKMKLDENFLEPNGELQEFNFLNGNFVIIPKIIFKKIGMIDSHYKHGMGDFDYGLRAKKAGFKLFLTPEYMGFCERHDPNKLNCYDSNFNILNRFRFLYSPFGPNPLINFKFYFNHFTLFKALQYFIVTNLVTAFPLILDIKSKK